MTPRPAASANGVPGYWYNIRADLPNDLSPALPNDTKNAISDDGTYPQALLASLASKERYIPIPDEVLSLYRSWRPTPLIRAERLEKALGTPARMYFKYEGASPSGSHKLNGAIPQAYYAAREGFRGIATPTGGQWGTAFAYAARLFGFEPIVFLMRASADHRPMRIQIMEMLRGKVIISPSRETSFGRRILEANPDHPGSLAIATSEVREYIAGRPGFVHSRGEPLHQTVCGLEAKEQMAARGEYPDVVIACLGFGSNFSGIAFPFFQDILIGERRPKIIGVEPKAVPVFTKGEFRYDFADALRSTVRIKMYTLGCDFEPPPIHGGGLRLGSRHPIISELYSRSLFDVVSCTEKASLEAGLAFMRLEGIVPATESAYAVKAAIDLALACRESGEAKVILTNISGNGYFDLLAYQQLLDGRLPEGSY
jgi:tryptophan synthase beta chain